MANRSRITRRLFVPAAAGLFLAACAPSIYKDEIQSFGQSLDSANAGLDGLRQLERSVATRVAVMNAQKDNEMVFANLENSKFKTTQEECVQLRIDSLPLKARLNDASLTDLRMEHGKIANSACDYSGPDFGIDVPDPTWKTAYPHAGPAAREMVRYGKNLAALAEAKDIAELNESVGKMNKALSALAKAVGGSVVPLSGAAVDGVLDMAGWLIGEYLAWERYRLLRDSVARAEGLIAEAADTFPRYALDIQIGDLDSLLEYADLLEARDKTPERVALGLTLQGLADSSQKPGPLQIRSLSPGDAAKLVYLREAQTIRGWLKALKTADPFGPFEEMKSAHNALHRALQDPGKVDPRAIFDKIKAFKEKAEKIRDAFKKD